MRKIRSNEGQNIITVIFSTRNGAKTLPDMLESLCRLAAGEAWQLLAVDNGSTDNSADIMREFADRLPLTVLEQPKPGKNRALNTALEHASGDLLVFTDDDIVADPGWLRSLRAAADHNPQHDVFGGKILPFWKQEPPDVVRRNAPLGVTYAITPEQQIPGPIFPGLVWGPNMAIRRRVFDAGHRFCEVVGPSGSNYIMGSETEFTIRLSKHGYTSWYTDAALVQHIVRPHQVSPDWVIRRAYRFGRNQWVQLHGTETTPKIFGIPRWRFAAYVVQCKDYLKARAVNDPDAMFRARWELSFLRGYLFEGARDLAARIGRRNEG